MKTFISKCWLNVFLSFTMAMTQILPAGYSEGSEPVQQNSQGTFTPVMTLDRAIEKEKEELEQKEADLDSADAYLKSIKESPLSLAGDPALLRDKKGGIRTREEVEEMARGIVREFLKDDGAEFETARFDHPFSSASDQVIDPSIPTVPSPRQGSLQLTRTMKDGSAETFTLTIGEQGLQLTSVESRRGDLLLSSRSFGYDDKGRRTWESETVNEFNDAGSMTLTRNSSRNTNPETGAVTGESFSETAYRYEGKNIVHQSSKSSNRYDNNGEEQLSESFSVIERVYSGDILILEKSESRSSMNGVETSGSTGFRKVELDSAGNAVFSETRNDSWSSYNGNKSEYHYETIEKSAYNDAGQLIERVTRHENKSTGYNSSSETRLVNTYENGFLIREETESKNTYNGSQSGSNSTVKTFKRDEAGRSIHEEIVSSYNGSVNSRQTIERSYFDAKSDKLASETTSYFYVQGDGTLQLSYVQSLKLIYDKQGILTRTYHQQDSYYGKNNTISYRNTVETRYNIDGKPTFVLSKNYGIDGEEFVLQSSTETRYVYSAKNADGKTVLVSSIQKQMDSEGRVTFKETKRYDERFSVENPSIREPQIYYDIAMPAYSYYYPYYWGWGGGFEKGLLSREYRYYAIDEAGEPYQTSMTSDRFRLDDKGNAVWQKTLVQSFSSEGFKTNQSTQEYELFGPQYNYGCCQVMRHELASDGSVPVHTMAGEVMQGGAKMIAPYYPYYYNSNRRLLTSDEIRYDENEEVVYRKTQRNSYVDGLLASASVTIKDGDMSTLIKETYQFDALGKSAKVVRKVYEGAKRVLKLTDERTYEYEGLGYGYGYPVRGYDMASAGGVSDMPMAKGGEGMIWAPYRMPLVKSVKVRLVDHAAQETAEAFLQYEKGQGPDGVIQPIFYDEYYYGNRYNQTRVSGTYTIGKEAQTIEGVFSSNADEHGLPTEKLMALLKSYIVKPSEYKTDETLLSELHNGAKIQIYEEFDHAATACAPMLGAICSSTKKVFYSYLLNDDRVYQIAAITERSAYGRNQTTRFAQVVSEADLERAVRAAGFHALEDLAGPGLMYAHVNITNMDELPSEGENKTFIVNYAVKNCVKGSDCSEKNYRASVARTVKATPEGLSYFHYDVRIQKDTRLVVSYEGGQAYVDWIMDEAEALIRTDIKTGEQVKFLQAKDLLSCSYPKDGPALCAGMAILPGHEQIGFYRKDLPDGGYEERIIMGIRTGKNPPIEEKGSPVVTGVLQVPDDSLITTIQRSLYTIVGENGSWLIDRLEGLRGMLDKLHGQKVSFIPGDSFSLEGEEIFTSGIIITGDGIAYVIQDGKIKTYKDAQFVTVSESRCPANPAMGAPCSIQETAMKMPGFERIHQHEEVFLDGIWVVSRTVVLIALPMETRLIVNYEGGQAYIDWISDEKGALIRTDVKTGEEVKFVEARDVMSCSYPKDGPALCASIALLPGHEQIGSYRRDLPDGGYEERIIFGLRADKNPPVEEKGSPVVTGVFQVPDDSMISTLQRSVYAIEGEGGAWLVDRLEGLRETLDKLHGQKVSFIPGDSFSLEGEEIFTSGIIITGDGIAYVIQDGKIKAYQDAKFITVSESHCPANPAVGAPCSIQETAMKMPGYEIIHEHEEVMLKDSWIVTRRVVLLGMPATMLLNFVPVEKMDSAEADRIRKAVGEGLELLGYEIDDGRPYDGNLIHHYAFRALSSSLVHMQRAANMNVIKQDPNGLIYEEKAMEDFGLDVFVNEDIRYIKEPEPRYIEVSAGVSRIEVAPGEQLMLSVVMELGGRRLMTFRDVNTPWQFTPLTAESAIRIKAALHHGLQMNQIGKIRMKLTGETAAKCPQGVKCSSSKEYEVNYFAEGKEFTASAQSVFTTFEGKQFTYYELLEVREALSKEERIRLAIEAAGQDLEALAAQMIIPENQALTEKEFAELDAKLKEIAEKFRALLVELREKINAIEGEDNDSGIIRMFGGPEGAIRLEQRAGLLLSEFYGKLMQTDALIVIGGEKVRIPVSKMTEILVGALPSGRWTSPEDYAKLLGFTPEFHPGDGIYLMNVFQRVMLSLAMGPSSRDLREMLVRYVLESGVEGLVRGGEINLRVFRAQMHGTANKIIAVINAARGEIEGMLNEFKIADVLSENEVESLLTKLDGLAERIRERLQNLKSQIHEIEGVLNDPSDTVIHLEFGGGPREAIELEGSVERRLGEFYSQIMSRDVKVVTRDNASVILPLKGMTDVLASVLGQDQMYSVEALGKVLGVEIQYTSGRIYFMHVFQFMMASLAAFPDVRTGLMEYVRNSEASLLMSGDRIDLSLFRLALLGGYKKMKDAVSEVYLGAAEEAGVAFFKAPEIALKEIKIAAMSKDLPASDYRLKVLYSADGGELLPAEIQIMITAEGLKVEVLSMETPFSGQAKKAMIEKAMADLSEKTGIALSGLKLKSAEEVVWNDGCLGVDPGPDMFCTMATVPGYRIILVDAAGKEYVYHTDRRSRVILVTALDSADKELSLAALPKDVSVVYQGSNGARTLFGAIRGYGKFSEISAEQGQKAFELVSDNRSGSGARGEFVFDFAKGFSLDALSGISFEGSMRNFTLVFIDADGNSVQREVKLGEGSLLAGLNLAQDGKFDAGNIRAFKILHSRQERASLKVRYGLIEDRNIRSIPEPPQAESMEIKGIPFDAADLTSMPEAALKNSEVFGGSLSTPPGISAFVSRLPQTDGSLTTRFHLAGTASEAGFIQPLDGLLESGTPLKFAMKGTGKVLVTLSLKNGDTITRVLFLNDKNFENFDLGAGDYESMSIISTRELLSDNGKAEKGEFSIRFGNSSPSLRGVTEVKARNTYGTRAGAEKTKRISSYERWKKWREKRLSSGL